MLILSDSTYRFTTSLDFTDIAIYTYIYTRVCIQGLKSHVGHWSNLVCLITMTDHKYKPEQTSVDHIHFRGRMY